MSIVSLLFKQTVIMFIYLLIGYILYRSKLITSKGVGEIGKILLYVIIPFAIINSYIKDFSREMLIGFLLSFAAALLSLILAIAVSTLFFHRKSAVREFGTAFSNAGFIGIPLVQMTLGSDAVFYVASYVALINIFQWTYGVLILTKDKSAVSAKKIVKNPILIALIIGLILFFFPIELPEILTTVISTLASINGPLAMIVVGAYLAQIPLKSLFTDKLTYLCSVVRLLIIPFLTILLLLFIPETYSDIRFAVLIAAAAPVGSNVAIFAQLYNKEYTDAVKDICLTTLFSIATMPLIIALANLIW